jgi:hypothetical protein
MRRIATPTAALGFISVLAACGPAPKDPSGAAPDGSAQVTTADGADPFVVSGELKREKLPAQIASVAVVKRTMPAAPKGVPAAPASCKAFVKRKAAPAAKCGDGAAARASLAEALEITDAAARDSALVALEACSQLPAGLARALRAELAPTACGDVLVAPLIDKPPAGVDGAIYDTLFGLALAARLDRSVRQPPEAKPPYTKERLTKYIAGTMGAWVQEQAAAIQAIAALGAKLQGYGKAIVAVEAGMADMRFVVAARTGPVPEEIAKFDEAKEKYQQNLELSLEPRKKRGRDAALVGLGQLAQLGVIRDPRLERARDLLSRMYGGSPINALDHLQFPPLSPVSAANGDQRLAARLPTFYAGLILPAASASDPAMLRMLIEKGVSLQHRIALSKAELPSAARLLYARARLELAQNYWRAVDVDEAAALLSAERKRSGEGDLLLAIALALRGGPPNAAAMMVQAPLSDLGIGQLVALDSIIAGSGPLVAMAAFDAALVKQLAAPATADAAYWQDVAKRFRGAAAGMVDATLKADAEQRAGDAEQTAEAIGKR